MYLAICRLVKFSSPSQHNAFKMNLKCNLQLIKRICENASFNATSASEKENLFHDFQFFTTKLTCKLTKQLLYITN